MKTPGTRGVGFALVVGSFLFLSAGGALAQDKPQAAPDPATVLTAAREVMGAQQYCGLITIDDTGRPHIRTMNPFPPDDGMVVWMATHADSRKVGEIRKDPRVALYYSDHAKAIGYVAITGKAELVDDMKEVLKRKRAYWDSAFPGLKNIVLIKVVPERIDVVNYKHGLVGDQGTWRAPSIAMTSK